MKGQWAEIGGFGGGFVFSLIVLLTEIVIFFSINVLTPVAIQSINASAKALNVTNTGVNSPTFIFGLMAIAFVIIDLIQNFLAGYFGGAIFGAGFSVGEIIILLFLSPILGWGVVIAMIVALIVLWLGVIFKG